MRVRKASEGLLHQDDVGACREPRPAPDDVGVGPAYLDPVVEQPPDEPFASASLRWTARSGRLVGRPADERDEERLRVLDHPVVLVLREPAARDQGVVAAVDLGRAGHAAPEDLQLIVQDGVPVLEPEVGRRVEDEVLLALRPERPPHAALSHISTVEPSTPKNAPYVWL